MLSDRFAAAFEAERVVADGEAIVLEGEQGHEMFIVKRGTVVISRMLHGERVILSELGVGEFFGEMSLLESLPRDADAHAKGETAVLAMGPGALLVRLRRDPSLALEMLHRLSGRVRTLNRQLAEAMGPAGPSEVPDVRAAP
jgi:CRP-like cAMP-binding protein